MIVKRGFTLIEMLIVIAIIAILSSVLLMGSRSAKSKANYSQLLSDSTSIVHAAEMYKAEYKRWPYDEWGPRPGGGSYAYHETGLQLFLSNKPSPPCPSTWGYDWENWSGSIVRVSLRDHGHLSGFTQYHQCLYPATGCTWAPELGSRSIPDLSSKRFMCEHSY